MPLVCVLKNRADNVDLTEELSEEDQQLKNELEMLVERILVSLCAGGAGVHR